MSKPYLSLAVVAALCFGGCSLSPSYTEPKVDLPDSKSALSFEITQKWWEDFGDVNLNAYVEEALRNNYDLLVAMERIDQANSNWSYARGDRFPTLGVSGQVTKNKYENQQAQQLGGILSFELDLWGRARDMDRSALAKLLASKANKDVVRLSLIANVMQSYFGILALNNQVDIARKTYKSRVENYLYRKKEFDVGKISEIDMQQAKSEMESVGAQLQSILMQQNAAQSAFMILLGRNAKEIFENTLPKLSKELPKAPVVKAELSSEILERRPDIEVAEQNLKAANFSIGVARSAYFPTISLTGLLGYASEDLNALFNSSSGAWNVSGSFLMNIIDFGRTNANINLSKSQYREMLLNYAQVVRTAFGEVRNVLFDYEATSKRVESLEGQVIALERTLELADLRYKEGYTSYLEVLSTQSALFSAELSRESARLESLNAVINLYKAFGGGWKREEFRKNES